MTTPAPSITAQLDAEYAAGNFAVVVTQTRIIPVRERRRIREAKGGVEVQHGRKWLYAYAYQVKFAHNV
jgi:hypothetical protein